MALRGRTRGPAKYYRNNYLVIFSYFLCLCKLTAPTHPLFPISWSLIQSVASHWPVTLQGFLWRLLFRGKPDCDEWKVNCAKNKTSRFLDQGCQMVYFNTQNPNLGKFWRVSKWKCWYILWPLGLFYGHILWPFGIFCGNLVYFSPFGMLYLEKSSNPV
jgi:hypothetical protein